METAGFIPCGGVLFNPHPTRALAEKTKHRSGCAPPYGIKPVTGITSPDTSHYSPDRG